MPILNPDDAREVEDCFKSLFVAAPQDRAREIRKLFVEVLDFEAATGQVNLAGASSSNVTLPATAERIAQLDGVHVLYIDLNTVDNDRVRKAEVEAAAKSIRDVLGDDILLIVTNKFGSQLHIIRPDFSGARLVLRRMVVGRDVPRRTVVQQVSNIYETYLKSGNLRAVLSKAFDVEEVTDKFFKKYKEIFEDALQEITGFGGDDDDAKRLFVQTLFNRLMFVHFLSRKGWLTINDDKDYLRALWIDYRNTPAPSPTGIAPNFYRDHLRLLFFTGLNNPDSRDLSRGASPLIGSVPFLNGGLFTEGEHDAEDSPIVVPDSVLEGALAELFEKFNFTVMESTPFDIEVAVDPEMLGKVFEELVNERHDSGAYYTPRPVVAFMCREALKGYLEGKDTGVSADAIAGYIENRDTGGISVDAARRIGAALDEITVVDPACGSGAFLLGMMQELVDLQTTLYNAGVDSRSLHALKLHIIERNLYGVDIDEFAVNIAMLRLWLSLAIDFDGVTPPALPNLDFKIVRGDSLLGPDPSPDNYGTLFRDRVVRVADQFAELKGAYMNESDRFKKAERQDEIEAVERELTAALSESPAPEDAVDWRVQFAEVFALRGDFDVAIANPPYVVIKDDLLRKIYAKGIYGRMNTYGLFIHRCLQLMRHGSQLIFINPRTFLTDAYFRQLRKLVREQAQISGVVLIEDRHNTFARVLQECIILHLAKPASIADSYQVRTRSVWRPDDLNDPAAYFTAASNQVLLDEDYDHALYIGTSALEYAVFERMQATGLTLLDLGLKAETGKVQFDKSRQFAQIGPDEDSFRLIWAENVQRYNFTPSSKRVGKEWLAGEMANIAPPNVRGDAILTQRTTANEQPRRIIANWVKVGELPEKGAYSENGTNFITIDPSWVSAHHLIATLNSAPIEFIFRRLNSNVHVSAGELNRLPLPPRPEGELRAKLEMHIDTLMEMRGDRWNKTLANEATNHELAVDQIIGSLYGISPEDIREIQQSLPSYDLVYG